jgi:hypothetical protein
MNDVGDDKTGNKQRKKVIHFYDFKFIYIFTFSLLIHEQINLTVITKQIGKNMKGRIRCHQGIFP